MAGSASLVQTAEAQIHQERLSCEQSSQTVVSSQLTLQQAVHARRSEFTRPRDLKIKVGTWNVAGHKGVEKDLGAWFAGGAGIAESLVGLNVDGAENSSDEEQETVGRQESRVNRRWFKKTTLPKHDRRQQADSEDVGLYVLGLQEIVDINSPTEALRPFADNSSSKKFKKALEKALPKGYELVAEQQLIGLLLLIYAHPDVSSDIRAVSTTSVGTGLMGYMGNKGAVTTRLVLGETTRLVFVNSHMSAGTGKAEVERRNWDYSQIVQRTKFDPIVDSMGLQQTHGEQIGDEDVAFWFGDLNYRLEGIPPEDVRRLLMLHTRNEYDDGEQGQQKIDEELSDNAHKYHLHRRRHKDPERSPASSSHHSSTLAPPSGRHSGLSPTNLNSDNESLDSSSDPTSLQATIDSLLPHDELRQQQKAGKAFPDWREGRISFLPSFKYDVGSVGVFDSSEKKRGPSWCDRILYRTQRDRHEYQTRLKNQGEAHKRDAALIAQGIDKAADDEDMLFEYDPEADGEHNEEPAELQGQKSNDDPENTLVTKEGFEDSLALKSYLTHMRVLSSDHKPVDAVFVLRYDAVDPELKRKVHADVAREIDKAENEGRPVVTIVGDHGPDNNNLDHGGVNFRGVRYNDAKTRSITIANTGKAVAYFGFAARPVGSGNKMQVAPEWLRIRVDHPVVTRTAKFQNGDTVTGDWSESITDVYSLEPGDACSVELVAVVQNMELVRALNEGQLLEDVLILRVRDGRDHFLPVRGVWKHSSHGRTIDALIRIPEGGLRKLQHQQPHGADKTNGGSDGAPVRWSVPREIFRLTEGVEAVTERCIAEQGMLAGAVDGASDSVAPWLRVAGWPFTTESWALTTDDRERHEVELYEALDNDQAFDALLPTNLSASQHVEIFASALLLFLHNLQDGIVTPFVWDGLERDFFRSRPTKPRTASASTDERASVLEILAAQPYHSACFVLVTAMLARILNEISQSTQEQSTSTGASMRLVDDNATVAIRQRLAQSYAAVFAEALVRLPAAEGTKRRVQMEVWRKELVLLFLE